MKNLIGITLILLLMGGLAACQAINTPVPPTPIPTKTKTPVPPTAAPTPTATFIPPIHALNGPPLKSIYMFSENDGWGLINNSLLITHTGGTKWLSVPLPDNKINEQTQTYFIDAQKAYLLIPSGANSQSGEFLYTANGGGEWQTNQVPFAHGKLTVRDDTIFFLEMLYTSQTSMASAVYYSRDNGKTWNRVYPPAQQTGIPDVASGSVKTGIGFINVDKGWIGVANQPQKITLYRTTNSGASWDAQQIDPPQNITSLTTTTLPPVFFQGDGNNGLLPVDFIANDSGGRNRVFYFTQDGGENWFPGESITDGGAYTFLDAQTGWIWGKRGLFSTKDGADTWQLLPVAFGKSEVATFIDFIDKNNGWLITMDASNRVRIYSTNDGGNTWIAVIQ